MMFHARVLADREGDRGTARFIGAMFLAFSC